MKLIRKACAYLGMAVFLLCCNPAAAKADDDVLAPKETVTSVAKELICDCPDCGKQSLDQCAKCSIGQKYRDVISTQLKEGKSKDQIITFFANTYGEHMLGNPRPTGFNRSATLLPPMAALLGLVPLILIMRKRRKISPAPTVSNGSSTTPQIAVEDPRVTAALKDFNF